MIAVTRRFADFNALAKGGTWDDVGNSTPMVSGKKIGIERARVGAGTASVRGRPRSHRSHRPRSHRDRDARGGAIVAW